MNDTSVATHGFSMATGTPAADTAADVTTILIVDDHRSFADLLSAALDTVPGMRCVGTASAAAEGVAKAAALRPSIVVMDIQMPRQDGLQATRQIREAVPETLVAVVTAHRDPDWVSRAAQAGASAFIPKDGSLAEMIDVLRNVRAGKMLVAPGAFRAASSVSADFPATNAPSLTQRELDVLTYLGQGMPAKGIAKVLGITLHTCRGYIKSLHQKLGVSSQLEAVIKAQHLGLIGSSEEA
jgi:DNA-binding NarL/FixJ family response regulator